MESVAFQSTKWSLDVLSRLIKADVRLHNTEVIKDDMSVIFVVNHFTRLETLLLPYSLHKHLGMIVWSLAHAGLFSGRIGSYLRSVGTISTHDPHRDEIIVSSLLEGEHPWIIFPEGAMIKDKQVIDHAGMFSVWNHGQRRSPHTGAAVLALRTEYYRHKLRCIHARPDHQGLQEALAKFKLSENQLTSILRNRTAIIPVNITYYPIRAQENFVLKMVRALGGNLSERAVEELSVEGTVLSSETDIDITLGKPIFASDYLKHPDYCDLLVCGSEDMQALENNPQSVMHNAARSIMLRYMSDIYALTTINYDHIFATLIRHQRAKAFTERAYRNRIFYCAHELRRRGKQRLHNILETHYRDIIYEDESPKFTNFMSLCLQEGLLSQVSGKYIKNFNRRNEKSDFGSARMLYLTRVIANELEPLSEVTKLIDDIANMSRTDLSRRIRKIFIDEELEQFNQDYTAHYHKQDSKPQSIGAPFLKQPKRIRGGIVLIHGYLAAPQEVAPLADYLYQRGYVVYGVRLQGHGTSAEDLAGKTWEDWYDSLNRGYTIIKSFTDNIILGGFSTGGALALLAAGRKKNKVQSVFSINAPKELKKYSAHLVPTVVTMNSLMQKIKGVQSPQRIFVANHSENPHINYPRNPLIGVRELKKTMDVMSVELGNIVSPALIVQGSLDPVVHPVSGQHIFYKVGTPHKELLMLDRNWHNIVTGAGTEQVFTHIHHFLQSMRNIPPASLSATANELINLTKSAKETE